MAWVKNARVDDENSLKALREQINTLASALNTTGNNNSNGGSKAKTDTNQGTKRGNGQNGKLKGPETSSNGPYREGQKPFQCYKCGGWGHTARVCPSSGNQNWRTLNRPENPPEKESPIKPKKQ